jgi:hypothetical protein
VLKAYTYILLLTILSARVAALVDNNRIITAETPTHITYPTEGGNVHSFTALSATALFDILAPPYPLCCVYPHKDSFIWCLLRYNDTNRPCTYYQEGEIEHDDAEELKSLGIELYPMMK